LHDFLDALVRGDRRWCLRIHQLQSWRRTARVLAVVSRMGDGAAWYVLMGAIALGDLSGKGPRVALLMLVTGIITLALYKAVKNLVARPRPCERYRTVQPRVPPLDRWSFPSGHTMHAVAFTCVAVSQYQVLIWLLAPFTLLIMASRVVLGLHYPSDVFAGAFCGFLAAMACIEVGQPFLGG
jgi:undecaprenyl-diphosphatase